MNKKYYIIRTYKMMDAVLYTHEELICDEVLETKKFNINDDFFTQIKVVKNGKIEYFDSSKPYIYAVSDKPMGYEYDPYGLLPYYATVKEDVPASMKNFANLYPNCKLKMEKHGAYLQFLDLTNTDSNTNVHRIAINSNTYTPNN